MVLKTITKAVASIIGLTALCIPASAQKLVMLHTNDTHSAIEADANGRGGIVQRKAVIDSVRKAEKNVLVIDAGDMVQGSLFFKYFRGDVEYPLMDMAGYDIRILGNHEFDNGMSDLAERYKAAKGAKISTNYDFTGTELEGVLQPFFIKKAGGKKIGFIGLNINPESLIAKNRIDVKFNEILPAANKTAAFLKNKKGCDLVVAVTHIGYSSSNGKTSDVDLAKGSRDIDIIIGGHTHTLIMPSDSAKTLVPNADGRLVRIVQSGKGGQYVGHLSVDLSDLKSFNGSKAEYSLIPVTDRFNKDDLDPEMTGFLVPFREKVNSVNGRVIGHSFYDLDRGPWKNTMGNMTADFGLWYGNHKADSLRSNGMDIGRVDLAIMNRGGIRHPMPAGDITEGQILSTYPFSNRFTIIALKGQDIIDALKIVAPRGGEAVSGNVRVVTDGDNNLVRVVIDGDEMDPFKIYLVGTIDYVAEGNDDLTPLANHKKIWTDTEEVCVPILWWFKRQTELGLPVAPDPTPRFLMEVR